MQDYYVYILRCADDSYYTGVTSDLERRMMQHEEGEYVSCYTYKRRPIRLAYVVQFGNVNDALMAEKQIKGWSRKKKEALIIGDIALLKGLSMSSEKMGRLIDLCASSPLRSAQHDTNKPLQSTQHDTNKPLQSTQDDTNKPLQSTQDDI